MADSKIGDIVIAKREDGNYDILRVDDQRELVRAGVRTLEDAGALAREHLQQGATIWYRDFRDAPNYLDLFR